MAIRGGRWLAGAMLAATLTTAMAQLQPWGDYPPLPSAATGENAGQQQDHQDPYRILMQQDDVQVRAWMKKQAALADSVLTHIAGRNALLQSLYALRSDAATVSELSEVHASQFYLSTDSAGVQRLFVRNAATGGERILMATGAGESIAFFTPAPDASLVAVAVVNTAAGGARRRLQILRSSDGSALDDMPDGIDTTASGVAWKPDASALYFRRSAGAGTGNAIWQHVLGQAASKDRTVIAAGLSPRLKLAAADMPQLQTQSGSPYVLAEIRHAGTPWISIYFARLAELKGAATSWQRLAGPADKVREVRLAAERLLLLSEKKSDHGSVLKLALKRPQLAGAQEIVKAGADTLLALAVARNAAYIHATDGNLSKLLKLDMASGKQEELALPLDGRISRLDADAGDDGALLVLEALNAAPLAYRVLADGQMRNTELLRPAQSGVHRIASKRLTPPGQQGAALTLIYPQALASGSLHATLLIAQQKSRTEKLPHFDASWLAWLERDGLIALVSLPDRPEGRQPDAAAGFIAAADYLVKEGYTSSKKLLAQEAGPGGMTVATAVSRRPELFAAVQITDAMADVAPPDGKRKAPKRSAAVAKEVEYPALRAGVRYPALLLSGATAEPGPAAAAYVARLQAASASNSKPVLLRSAAVGEDAALNAKADAWAFFLWQAGEPGFSWQP
ncbi:MAG: prolyl oligopeptidase family serine peptidase [Burkholderiales bacterium]|nr:prolyl oligopeptidase family serine peptidase [Burkholderiales bacterium]